MQKTIFVTGAASGIGRASALLFARRGYAVGCWDVDLEGAERVAKEIGPAATHGRLDVTREESWAAAVSDFGAATGGRMDVLFNSAGILRMGRFEDVPPAECRRQLDVNVMGVILGVQACLPLLDEAAREHAKGARPGLGPAIVTMSSASAIYGQPELAVYSATKFAVRALTEALDLELAPRGIRVADVMPGYVDTPMVHTQTHRAATLDKMGVKLKAEDVAEIVWKAANGRGLHYVPQRDLRLMQRLGGLVPELGRVAMRRMTRATRVTPS